MYTFLAYQYALILKQDKKLLSTDVEKKQRKRFYFNIHSLTLKKRIVKLLIIIFVINEFIVVVTFLKLVNIKTQLKSFKKIILIIFAILLFLIRLKANDNPKLLKILKQNILLCAIVAYFLFSSLSSEFIEKNQATKMSSTPMFKICKKTQLKSISFEINGTIRLARNHVSQNKIILKNPVIAYKSEPGKLIYYYLNGKKGIVSRFNNKKFSNLEIKKILSQANKRNQELKINDDKKTSKRIKYFNDFIGEDLTKNQKKLSSFDSETDKSDLTIKINNFKYTFKFKKEYVIVLVKK